MVCVAQMDHAAQGAEFGDHMPEDERQRPGATQIVTRGAQ
ncbi:hypothetical protein GCM10009578_046400 [Streptomyces rhizosphaericus]